MERVRDATDGRDPGRELRRCHGGWRVLAAAGIRFKGLCRIIDIM